MAITFYGKTIKNPFKKKKETITISQASLPTVSSIKSIDYGTSTTERTGGTTVVTTNAPSSSGGRSSGGRTTTTTVTSVGQTPNQNSPSVQKAITQTQQQVQSNVKQTQLISQQATKRNVMEDIKQNAVEQARKNYELFTRERGGVNPNPSFVSKALKYPEEKIQQGLDKIRKTKGTQLVLTRPTPFNPFNYALQTEGYAQALGQEYIRTPINTADVINVGSFFIPIVGQSRVITVVGSTSGKLIAKEPISIAEVGTSALIGGGALVKSSREAIAFQRVKEVSKLESTPIKFVQTVDKETGILNFIGKRQSGGLRQDIAVQGIIKKTETGKKIIDGGGASAVYGNFEGLFGTVARKDILSLQTFRVGGKGYTKQVGQVGDSGIFKQIGSTGVEPIISFTQIGKRGTLVSGGTRTKDISSSTLFQLRDKVGLSLSKQSSGVILEVAKVDDVVKIGFRGGGSGGKGVRTIQESAVDIVQSFKQIPQKIIKPSIKTPTFKGITGIVRAEEYTPTIVAPQSYQQPTVIISENVIRQDQSLSAGKITQIQDISQSSDQTSLTSSGSRSRTKQRQETTPIQTTIVTQIPTQKTPQRTSAPQISQLILETPTPFRPTFPPITPRINIPRITKTPAIFKVKSSKTRGSGLFAVSVRRFGKFRPVGTSIEVGQAIVSGGLGATFKVTGKGSKRIRTPKGFKRKFTKEGILFIEEPKFRLSTKGEKVEIQQAKRTKKK